MSVRLPHSTAYYAGLWSRRADLEAQIADEHSGGWDTDHLLEELGQVNDQIRDAKEGR